MPYFNVKIKSIYKSKIFNTLPNKLNNSLMFPLPNQRLFLQLPITPLLQIVDIHLHPLKHLLLTLPDRLQLPLQQQHLTLQLVNQMQCATLALLFLT